METTMTATAESSNKRPRSLSGDLMPPAAKSAKTHSNHLQINYLARQYNDNIPLVNVDDTLPSILHLIQEYEGVLHRHESIAGNLGACPLGPILIKRFERLFDGPPRVLKSHGKEGTTVSWLDVVDFARNKPEQFNLEKMRNGIRVCQFYTKQSRVEISEEDYVLIASGMPQKLIPPQPIEEDEEKELGALEILEKNLVHIVQLADQVSARARQLKHRLHNRKAAIISRRESEAPGNTSAVRSPSPPAYREHTNGTSNSTEQQRKDSSSHPPHSPLGGFTAVNVRQSAPAESMPDIAIDTSSSTSQIFTTANTDNVTIINGTSIKGASPTTRAELMKKFFSTADRNARGWPSEDDVGRTASSHAGRSSSATRLKQRSDSTDLSELYRNNATSPAVPIPSTPSSLLPHLKPTQPEKDDGGPYKAEMVTRMDTLAKGERVLPPCDRCRRLHMDCLKNLTACQGCTKKHAKCSWKDVKEEELREGRHLEMSTEEHEHSDTMHSSPDGGEITPARESPNANGTSDAISHTPPLYEFEHTPARHPPALVVEKSTEIEISHEDYTPEMEKIIEHVVKINGDVARRVEVREAAQRSIEDDDDDDDEGDRLQNIVAKVMRSASQTANS